MDAAERISLLLIEDDESHVALIERAFEAWQSLFDLSVVHTLQEAYALLSGDPPDVDLIICDLRLPDGEGLELLAFNRALPVILMTGYGDERVAVEAIRSGALDYIVKSDAAFADLPHVRSVPSASGGRSRRNAAPNRSCARSRRATASLPRTRLI